MSPGEEALARERIRDTLARYNLAGDAGRVDELADCFSEDGVLEVRGWEPLLGRAAIAERLGGLKGERRKESPRALQRHHLTTSRIELAAEDEAEAHTYFLVVSEIGLDHAGRYRDRLVRQGDRWLLAHRRVEVDWQAEGSRYPRQPVA